MPAVDRPQQLKSRPTAQDSARNSSIVAHRDLLRTRKASTLDLVTGLLDDISRQSDLNIFITLNTEEAIEQAKQADSRIARGEARALEGVPLAIKDNFCTKGIRTTAGSRILDDFIPTYESTVTQRLIDAGAIFLGKTNMDEFAMGSSTENSHFGPTINPAGASLGFPNLVPGGSSGGSAAAVAARLALGAVGTDTGGSVRQPASFCGVVGMKPSYGVCSRWGIIAYGSSLDQAGALGRSVQDVAVLMDVIAGPDARDTTSVPGIDFEFERALAKPAQPLRIGFPREIRSLTSTDDAERVWSEAERIAQRLAAEIVEVSIPSIGYALPAYYIIALSEASSNLARYDGVRYGYRAGVARDILDLYEQTRAAGFGAEVKRRIMLGTYALSAGYYDAYYKRALRVRKVLADEFARAFTQADVIFTPTTPTSAFEIGSHQNDPVTMYLEDIFTVPINLAGLPAVSVPITHDRRGMPLGLQIIGPHLGDETVIRAAASVEIVASLLDLQ